MEQDKIYRWVKASERLPILEKNEESKYLAIKANGLFFSAFYNLYNKSFRIDLNVEWGVKEYDRCDICWLEEQTDVVVISKERYEGLENCAYALERILNAVRPYNSTEFASWHDTARTIAMQALDRLNQSSIKK